MKKPIATILLLVFTAIMQSACVQQVLQPRAYMTWVEDKNNGLKITESAGDYIFNLQYKPLDYIVLINERTDTIDRKKFDKDKEELKDMQYYTFSIAPKNGKTEMLRSNLNYGEEYYQRVQYFSFHLKDDLYLIDGNDSLPCLLCHFERSYDLTPNNKFLLAFPLSKKETSKRENGNKYASDKTLIYQDKLLNTGIVKLEVTKNAIDNIPSVKL